MGTSLEEAALGIIRIVNANMAKGISGNSVERGYDLREFALVAMGGATALHAVNIARDLNMAKVIIPPICGNFSAVGLVVADIQHDYVRTLARKAPNLDPEDLLKAFKEMEETGMRQVTEEKVPGEAVEITWSADLRYEGQSWELNTPIKPVDRLDRETIWRITEDFHSLHAQVYSYSEPGEVVEFVNLRVRVLGKNPTLTLPEEEPNPVAENVHWKELRGVYLEQGRLQKIPIYERDQLRVGTRIAGPSIVEEQISTTLIPHGFYGRVDEYKNIIIEAEDRL
jgi:N-methylhydantoinase A